MQVRGWRVDGLRARELLTSASAGWKVVVDVWPCGRLYLSWCSAFLCSGNQFAWGAKVLRRANASADADETSDHVAPSAAIGLLAQMLLVLLKLCARSEVCRLVCPQGRGAEAGSLATQLTGYPVAARLQGVDRLKALRALSSRLTLELGFTEEGSRSAFSFSSSSSASSSVLCFQLDRRRLCQTRTQRRV